jgi:AraC-like DNA-binding protein
MEGIEKCNLRVANFFYVDSPSWQYAERRRGSPYNMIFVTEGVLYMELEDTRYTVKKNEFLFMPQGSISRGYRGSEKPTCFYHVIFSADVPPNFLSHFTVANTANIRVLYALLTDVSKNVGYSQEIKNALLSSLLYEISYQHSREGYTVPKEDITIVEKIKVYIDNSIHRRITLNDVAHHFGFSVQHTQRLFLAREHITVKAYINELRIKRIEECLMSTNASTSVIAKKFGFPNPNALNKYYKYHTGRTIKEYHSKFND